MPGDEYWQNIHIVLFEGVGLVTRETVIEFATLNEAVLVVREMGDEGRPHYHLAIVLKEKTRDKPLRDLVKATFGEPGVVYKRNSLYNFHKWNKKPADYYLEEYFCKGIKQDELPDVVYSYKELPINKHHNDYWLKQRLAQAASHRLAKMKADDKSENAKRIIADAIVHFKDDIHPRTPMDVLYFVIDEMKGAKDDKEHAIVAQRILFILDKKTTRVAMATRIYNRFFT